MSVETRSSAGKGVLILGYVALAVGACAFLIGLLGVQWWQAPMDYAFLFLSFAFICFASSAILSGKIQGKHRSYERETGSGSFWFEVCFQAFIGVACAFIGLRGILGPG